ncbi:MAG: DUF433 domain-containing protein [Pyrinomonadaceae bacterium]
MKQLRTKRAIGRHIVADPKICHGQPTFRGTRVLVADVLSQVASGMDWQSIIEDWHGNITEDAIREAVDLASRALIKHADDFVLNPISA